MPAYRFFTQTSLKALQEFKMEDLEHRHLKQVMRLEKGDTFEATDGQGHLALCKLIAVEKNYSLAQILQLNFFEKTHELVLLQAMPKTSNLEWIIEKGTELGLTQICLFQGDRSVQKISVDKKKRLETLAISALKQCGRLHLPKIEFIQPIKAWATQFDSVFYGDVSSTSYPLLKQLSEINESKKLTFACGPEAGFSKEEIKLMENKGLKKTCLHYNILRAETAPLSFLSLASHFFLIQNNSAIVN